MKKVNNKHKVSLTIKRSVRLWRIHSKCPRVEGSKIASARDGTDAPLCVVDNQGVRLSQEGDGGRGLVLVGIPHNLARRLNSLVHGDGVGGLVGATRRNDVDGRRGDTEGCIIPAERDEVADFVELRAGKGTGRDHLDSTRW